MVLIKEIYGFDDDLKPLQKDPSDLSKVTELLLNEKFARRKTILHQRLIGSLATLDTLAQIWDITFLRSWIPSYCEYLTSNNGKGRQDIVDITKFTLDKQSEHDNRILDLMGRR